MLKIDSRELAPGDVFVALPGQNFDGRDYIEQAFALGAKAVLAEAPCEHPRAVAIPNLSKILPQLAAGLHGYPSHKLKVIAVTGTNGKTSITHFIAQLYAGLAHPCAVMGTLGNGLLGDLSATTHTTRDCCELQAAFANFVSQSIPSVAMEVSSHALEQRRFSHTQVEVAVFSNLTPEHLDYHGTMDAYFAAKAKLFTDFAPRYAIINLDSEYAARLISLISSKTQIRTYSLRDTKADYCWAKLGLVSNLAGDFNKSNILASVASLNCQGVELANLRPLVEQLFAAPGRLQPVSGSHANIRVLVDFAHSPDALANALRALQVEPSNRLICVFGCGGDRDRAKRPLMLEAALEYCDKVVVTTDNPRHEAPEGIIKEIVAGREQHPRVEIIVDREQAIVRTINNARNNDTILLAGKGHEDYQIIGASKVKFSDHEIAAKALKLRNEACLT